MAAERGDVAIRARALATERYPALRVDPEKINAGLREAAASTAHYARVAITADGVVGALIGVTGHNLWAQRKHCGVVLWYAEMPGAGAALLRDFKRWLIEQRNIRVAGFQVDCDIDPRALSLMERIGFRRRGGARLWYRREELSHGNFF